jgi:hypothetical protein
MTNILNFGLGVERAGIARRPVGSPRSSLPIALKMPDLPSPVAQPKPSTGKASRASSSSSTIFAGLARRIGVALLTMWRI